MKTRVALVCLAAAVLVVTSAVAASGASAAMTLPEFSVATPGTGTSGPSTLFGVAEIKCKKGKGAGIAINKKEGAATGDAEECTLAGSACHSLGDPSGVILGSGTGKLVLDTLGGVDHRLVLGEGPELHIECNFLSTLVLVKGALLGTIESKGTNKKEFTGRLKATSSTTQEFKEYENDAGEKVTGIHLEAATDGGSFSEAAVDGEGVGFTEKATEIMN